MVSSIRRKLPLFSGRLACCHSIASTLFVNPSSPSPRSDRAALCLRSRSEVQHECIPQAILGMDILCQAKSGMGKTAVFVLATLQQIDPVDGQVGVSVRTAAAGEQSIP